MKVGEIVSVVTMSGEYVGKLKSLEPLTLEEKNKLFQKSANFNDLSVLVDLLIMKLLVKNDKGDLEKAFKPEDKFALRKKADTTVIATISNKILADSSYEEAEKK